MANISVSFTIEDFRQDYPQFADSEKYSERRLSSAFKQASSTLDNTKESIIPYDPDNNVYVRETALYALTCHYLTVSDWTLNGQSGAVTSATEGSVSVSFSTPQASGTSKDFFNQTPCGQLYLSLIAPYSMGGVCIHVKEFHPWG